MTSVYNKQNTGRKWFKSQSFIQTDSLTKEEFSLANTDHFKHMQLCNAIPSSWKTSLLKDSENTHGLVLYEPHIVINQTVHHIFKLRAKFLQNLLLGKMECRPTA